jgi:geranylgeranyl pyrophosphate synthase
MYTLNFKSLLRLPENRDEVLASLLDSYLKIVAGQELDLSFVSKKWEKFLVKIILK